MIKLCFPGQAESWSELALANKTLVQSKEILSFVGGTGVCGWRAHILGSRWGKQKAAAWAESVFHVLSFQRTKWYHVSLEFFHQASLGGGCMQLAS